MKKIVAGAVALLCAASIFAVDFAATVQIDGSLAGGAVTDADDASYIWMLGETNQKDTDALVLSVNGEKSGASVNLYYTYKGNLDDSFGSGELKVRYTKVWFKPLDNLTVTLGHVNAQTYVETLHWWKDAAGSSYAQASGWYYGYRSSATNEGEGINVEWMPIDGLWLAGTISCGTNNGFVNMSEAENTDTTVGAYGFAAKYWGFDGLPLSIGASWYDGGTDAAKILAIGADYGNHWGEGFYGFLNARMFFDSTIGSIGGTTAYVNKDAKSLALTGIAFDNYFRFQSGALVAQFRVPFVLRGLTKTVYSATGDEASVADYEEATGLYADPSYIYWSAEIAYAMDGITPYITFGSDTDAAGNLNGWVFQKKDAADSFNVAIQPGVRFNVGAVGIDISAVLNIQDAATKADGSKYRPIGWSIPFATTIGF